MQTLLASVTSNSEEVLTNSSSKKVQDVYYHKTLRRTIKNWQYKRICEITASKNVIIKMISLL